MTAQNIKQTLNRADANTLPDAFRGLALGDIIRALPTFLWRKVPVANAYNLAAVQAIVLPDDAKALTILRAHALSTSAAGTLGPLAPQTYGTTPADAQIAVSPNGDIVVVAASAYTSIDVQYVPAKQDVFELTLPVVANVIVIPTTYRLFSLLEAESLVGGVVSRMRVVVPGAAPAAGQANINIAKTQVQFAPADAVTYARVKIGVIPVTDVDAILQAASPLV